MMSDVAARPDLASLFDIDRSIVQFGAYADEPPPKGTRNRYQEWKSYAQANGLFEPEFLLPRIVRPCPPGLPGFMGDVPGAASASDDELRERIESLQKWTQYFELRKGVETTPKDVQRDRIGYRSHLLSGTAAAILGDDLGQSSILDLACNSGFFSLDMAHRGAGSVTGVELRERHHDQSKFLAEVYGLDGIEFINQDVYDYDTDRTFDVVFNFGLMYHLTQPLEVAEKTYRLCDRFAVFDSMIHHEPFAGYIAAGAKNTDIGIMGNNPMQFEPTYRGLIETLWDVGFTELIEVIGDSPLTIPFYSKYTRRTIIAIK
jgi:2-polyprenyl-3-methyl-5-hydroxy-6-metoxy-1,4-benzoquinol methylase